MWLHISGKDKKIDKWILNRKYNVEYKLENGKLETFNNVLVNIDHTHYWFLSEEHGLDIVKKDRIVTMVCIDRQGCDKVTSGQNLKLCPDCGGKLYDTYEINDDVNPDGDPKVYGVICSNCCYENYD